MNQLKGETVSELWKAERDGKVIGQFTFEQLKDLAKSGVLLPFDRLTDPSHGKPVLAKNIPELFAAPAKQEDPEPGPPKLWSPGPATAWGFVFSWLFPSILLGLNWHELKNKDGMMRCTIWSVGFLAYCVLWDAVASPKLDSFSWWGTLLGLVVFRSTECKYQQEFIAEHLMGQYRRRSWVPPIGFTLAFLVVCFLAMLADASLGSRH
jgi:hypothetical protein